jgi:NAD(P)-dependent dehydrogenase (short-subunit alcohol dehydrogenase family)
MSTSGTSPGAVAITGASTGIGKACVTELLKLGYHVFAGVHDQHNLASMDHMAAPNLHPVIIDLTRQDSIDRACQEVQASLGGMSLVGLINNAGVVVSGPLEFLPLDDLRAQFEINVFGHLAVTQALAPQLRAACGRIINIGSISGRFTAPFIGPYSASKFAFAALSDALRMEMRGSGVKVCVIEPGSIATPIWEKAIVAGDQRMLRMSREALDIYAERMLAFRAIAKETGERGDAPECVVKAVRHALTAAKPKPRYIVGRDARLAQLFLCPLPHRIKDKIILRHMARYIKKRRNARELRKKKRAKVS